MFDLLIKNAKIVDGTGKPAYFNDVLIDKGKIVKINSNLNIDCKEIIDAKGLTLTPGFIDSHSHDDFIMESVPSIYPKLEQGITTLITGMCGHSIAPLSNTHLLEGYRLYDALFAKGVNKDQKTRSDFKTYLDNLPNNFGCNVAFHVGHGSIRSAVMGFENRKPTSDELEQMKAYVRNAMEAGALGISFGLIYNPAVFADSEECLELAKVVKEYDGDMTIHMRNENIKVVEALEETLDIVKQTGIRCVISHHKCTYPAWGKCQKTIALIEQANKEGYQVYVDQYPYDAFSTALNNEIPEQYLAMNKDELMKMLNDPKGIKEISDAMYRLHPNDGYYDNLMVAGSINYPEYSGRMIKDIAIENNTGMAETILDILYHDDLTTSEVGFSMSQDDVEYIMKYPKTMIGTDGLWYPGAICAHPRAFGSFPRVLGYYVNKRHVLSFEEAIHKMTYLPASFYGLKNKGLISEGLDADLCLLDDKLIEDKADYKEFDKRCVGLKYVLINGEVVVKDSISNGKLLGKKIIRGQL